MADHADPPADSGSGATPPPAPDRDARAWIVGARRPEIAARLEAVYTMLSEQIEARGPSCWASGRCCNFAKTGHRLYVTGLEAAYTLTRLGPDQPRDAALAPAISSAEQRGDCPFLNLNLCGVHAIKPLGCRVYFCDRSAGSWQQDLSERGLSLIRAIHHEHEIPYRYGEWRGMLRLLASGTAAGSRS